MSKFYYTDDHLNRLREFFAEEEGSGNLRLIRPLYLSSL
jgi:hypothetical protein